MINDKKAFKKQIVVLLLLGTVAVLGIVVLRRPTGAVRSDPLRFELQVREPTSNSEAQISVIVSNASSQTLVYQADIRQPTFHLIFWNGNTWITQYGTPTFGGSYSSIAPHGVKRGVVDLPDNAKMVRVGMDYVSLSGKGELAWRLPRGGWPRKLFDPIGTWLMEQDGDFRNPSNSWSESIQIVHSSNHIEGIQN